MSMERTNLVKAREEKNWSQDDLAEKMEVSRHIISDWELGLKRPYPRNRRKLGNIFGVENTNKLLEIMSVPERQKPYIASDKDERDPGLEERQETDERTTGSAEAPPDFGKSMVPTAESSLQSDQDHTTSSALIVLSVPHAVQKFIASGLERRLWHIAHTNYSDSSEMTSAIQQAIEESDMMNMGNATYEINRREALCSLAALPMTTLGQKPTLHTRHYTETLMHCTAALEACWQLSRGSDPQGRQHAFECVCTYVPLLKTIARDSSPHSKEALDLASQYAILQTMLGWTRAQPREAVSYAQNALGLAKETGNILLHLSATTKLNWTHLRNKNFTLAWRVMQEGEQVLKGYQRKKNKAPLHPGIIGSFNSSYAMTQVDNGLSPDHALGIALDSEPLNEYIAFTQFTAPDQWWEAARTHCSNNNPVEAMKWLGKAMNLETLTLLPGNAFMANEQVLAINILTHSLLQSPERDLDRIIHTWTAAIERAKALRHEVAFGEAVANFVRMQTLYPGERRIMKLIPLTSHW